MHRLQLWNKQIKRRYRRTLVCYSENHKLLWKVQDYTKEGGITSSPTLAWKARSCLNGIGENTIRGIKHAEKRCRELCTVKVHYSPKLSAAGRVLSIWWLVLRYWLNRGVKRRTIRKDVEKYGIICLLARSTKHLLREVVKTEKKYKSLKLASF